MSCITFSLCVHVPSFQIQHNACLLFPKKAQGTVSVLKELPTAGNSVSNMMQMKDKWSDNQRCFFCENPHEQCSNNPKEDKAPITRTECKSSKQGFAIVNDWYHLETEDWQARRQFKITIGHLRFTVGIYQCLSVQWITHTTSVLKCKGFSFSLIHFEIT